MTTKDKPSFIRALHEAGVALGVPIRQELADIYWRELSDMPLPAVLAGLRAFLRSSRHLPTVADIRLAAEQTSGHSPGSQTPGSIGRASCGVCDGTGWAVRSTGHHSVARRCECRRGG